MNIWLVSANDVMEHFAFPGLIDFAANDQGAFCCQLFIVRETMFTIGESRTISHANDTQAVLRVPRRINSRSWGKLSNRCFCWFPSAMLMPIRMDTSMASPYKPLLILWKHFFGYLVYEIFLWPESWRGSLYIYLLSISQILDFIYWTVLIFILIYFKWRDTENQQYRTWAFVTLTQTAISCESCLTTVIIKRPAVFTQVACWWQSWLPLLHSSISE